MDGLTIWIRSIAEKTNDDALLFVMFMNSEAHKVALYRLLLSHVGELMAQHVTERRVRAYCHLIKRAVTQGNDHLAVKYASELNSVLSGYAESLLNLSKRGLNDQAQRTH
ncbi:hypothetical protein [Vibrio agarivorans]|uniref:hypothetical protein n=1 Tax=Vibrio agarivorans TaxID=153622 RepID=UPI0025B622B3|nr:hypothetical protein [Vibrio agarivorans]MDN3661112.1 hypothetical protein [Vibrio agarivorans]